MAQLAIKGNATRGKEVIEILEMLGGSNEHNYRADCDSLCFYVGNENNVIYCDCVRCYEDKNTLVLTLEEFIKKFPYKVGDKVCFPDDLSTPFTINKMWWDENANELLCSFIEDDIEVPVVGIRTYKEETMEKEISGAIVNRFICLEGYDFYDDKGNVIDTKEITMKKKQPKYPKTYEECCEILEWNHRDYDRTGYKSVLFCKLQVLILCRDAYWEIAGDWEPNWTKADERKYCIVNTEGNITKWVQKTTNKILAFPTEEICDAFYENFKELIEECKELL